MSKQVRGSAILKAIKKNSQRLRLYARTFSSKNFHISTLKE